MCVCVWMSEWVWERGSFGEKRKKVKEKREKHMKFLFHTFANLFSCLPISIWPLDFLEAAQGAWELEKGAGGKRGRKPIAGKTTWMRDRSQSKMAKGWKRNFVCFSRFSFSFILFSQKLPLSHSLTHSTLINIHTHTHTLSLTLTLSLSLQAHHFNYPLDSPPVFCICFPSWPDESLSDLRATWISRTTMLRMGIVIGQRKGDI